jgi:hypothetical protein
MAILSRDQAKVLKYPMNKWILHRMSFHRDTWGIQEAIEYLKTYLQGQEVPAYIGQSPHMVEFLICFQVSEAQFKKQKLRNDIELTFQCVN